MLDGAKDRLGALLAYRVAKNAAEQPDIVTQRHVLVFDLIAFGFGMGPLSAAVVDGRSIVAGIMPCDPNRINRLRSAFGSHYAQL